MRLLKLTNCKMTAIVDDDDFELVSKFKWYFDGRYVTRTDRAWAAYRKHEPLWRCTLHSLITGENSREKQVDHKNGDRLDCRRRNLRFATPAENQRNQFRAIKNASGLKGVQWDKRKKRWAVRIRTDNGRIRLGTYADKITAAKVYDEAAIKYHGEFAKINGVK